MGSPVRPRAWSRRRESVCPKRAASGAPGQHHEVADAAESDPVQALLQRRRQAQPRDRQRGQGAALLPRGDDADGVAAERAGRVSVAGPARRPEAGHGPGRAGGVGDGGDRPEAHALEAPHQILEERPLAAEKPRAPAHVEPQAPSAPGLGVRRHPGRVTLAPLGQPVEDARVLDGIGLDGAETGRHGPGRGQREARADAGGGGPGIGRDHADAPLPGGDGGDHPRLGIMRAGTALSRAVGAGPSAAPAQHQPIGRKRRKPQ